MTEADQARPAPSPLFALADVLIGLGTQLKRVDETDRLLLAMGERVGLLQDRLVDLERRLSPYPSPEEQLVFQVDPPGWEADQQEQEVAPTPAEVAAYKPQRFDPAGVQDLERRAREALPEGRLPDVIPSTFLDVPPRAGGPT